MLRNNEIKKFFIFDRDDTLINKNSELINPQALIKLFSAIDQNTSLQWAIVSRGASDLSIDSAYTALCQHLNFAKEPIYVQFSESTLTNAVTKIQGYLVCESLWPYVDEREFAKKIFTQATKYC